MTEPVCCEACGIQIGPRFIETKSYRVGKYTICGWCRRKLKRQGHLEVGLRVWLYPDGSLKFAEKKEEDVAEQKKV
jgi:hypothetical protein